jgi:hypothetical protein
MPRTKGSKPTGKPTEPESPAEPPVIRFHMIKSNFFRVIHADGIFGGISPRGGIQIAFFSERQPIPQQMCHTLDAETGRLGDELEDQRITRDGVVREIEANVVMELPTAKSFLRWLEAKVTEADEVIKLKAASSPQQTRRGTKPTKKKPATKRSRGTK